MNALPQHFNPETLDLQSPLIPPDCREAFKVIGRWPAPGELNEFAAVWAWAWLTKPTGLPQPEVIQGEEPATINLGAICARLGFTVTSQFLEQALCVPPAGTDHKKTAKLYTERDWAVICRRLRAHIAALPAPEVAPIPGGWTGVAEADAALVMLDRLDVDSTADDARIEQIMAIVRSLARRVREASEPDVPEAEFGKCHPTPLAAEHKGEAL